MNDAVMMTALAPLSPISLLFSTVHAHQSGSPLSSSSSSPVQAEMNRQTTDWLAGSSQSAGRCSASPPAP